MNRTTGRRLKYLVALASLLALTATLSLSCLPEKAQAHSIPPPDSRGSVPASIEEQILVSDAIVVATLQSVKPDAEFVTGETEHEYYYGSSSIFYYPDSLVYYEYYRPMQVLRFLVQDYLKGSGPSEIVVEVRDYDQKHFTTFTEALAFAAETVTGQKPAWVEEDDEEVVYASGYEPEPYLIPRNQTWDDRPAVLFLQKRHSWRSDDFVYRVSLPDYLNPLGYVGESESFDFSQSNFEFQNDHVYTIDTLNRVWLPSHPSQEYGEWHFITDGNEDPPPLLSLSNLRMKIAEISALVEAGEGIDGYQYCLYQKITHEREMRAEEEPWTPFVWEKELGSGLPRGTELYSYTSRQGEIYDRFWVTGPDAALFDNRVEDEDDDPTNGYTEIEETTRPLPMGVYTVNFNTQYGRYISCDFIPSDNYYIAEITVLAPEGTLHEAFFDPTEAGSDDVSPAGFAASGVETRIEGLGWTGDEVALTLSPYVSLSGYALDFIALNGEISLSLVVDEGVADETAGTLSWPVATQPWANGDQLMLRIREVMP